MAEDWLAALIRIYGWEAPEKGRTVMGPLSVEIAEAEVGACACCAGEPGLRGFVYEDERARAVYFVEPLGFAAYPLIKLGVVIGDWSPGTPVSSRSSYALLCRPSKRGPLLAPAEPRIDAFPEFAQLGRCVAAADLADNPAFADWRGVAEAIIAADWRLAVLRDPAARPDDKARRFSADPG